MRTKHTELLNQCLLNDSNSPWEAWVIGVDEEALTRHCLICMYIPTRRAERVSRDSHGVTPRFPLHNRHAGASDSVVDTENESIKTISREEKQA